MIYCVNKEEETEKIEAKNEYFSVITFDKLEELKEEFNINEKIKDEFSSCKVSKFESHDGFDFISLKIPDFKDLTKKSIRICIYFRSNLLLFITEENALLNEIYKGILSKDIKVDSLGRILYIFFDRLTVDDSYKLENIEQEIEELEEALITSEKDNCIREIIFLRKKLLKLKRYYEQFINITELLEENENGLLDKKILRYYRMLSNRINRSYQSVINLRDYVTQVREAYQAQVDINQNKLMKMYTIITTIFFPLTLIVGWYGMNVNVPEFNWVYGYPFVITLSIVVILLCIIWFKKKRWF